MLIRLDKLIGLAVKTASANIFFRALPIPEYSNSFNSFSNTDVVAVYINKGEFAQAVGVCR